MHSPQQRIQPKHELSPSHTVCLKHECDRTFRTTRTGMTTKGLPNERTRSTTASGSHAGGSGVDVWMEALQDFVCCFLCYPEVGLNFFW